MRKFFKFNKTQDNYNYHEPLYFSELPKKSKEEIREHFLEISSLNEILKRYQRQRKLILSKDNNNEIITILNKETNCADKIEKKYKTIKSYLTAIDKNKDFTYDLIENILKEKNKINKKINIIHDYQLSLKLLIANAQKK